MAEKFVDINGIKICYQIHGHGIPVVLIHGFGSKKESFMAQIPVLSQKFKIISFDNRGSGKSERPDFSYTMEMFVDDIMGLLDYLKINKAHLIGLSLGGMIALTFVLKYPERVDKLILINTLARFPSNFDPEAYIKTKINGLESSRRDPEKSFWDSTQFGFHPKFRRKMKTDPNHKFYGLWSVNDVLEYYKTDPPTPQDIRNIASSFKTYNAYKELFKIKHQALLLTASSDKLVPMALMRQIHEKMANSVLIVIENAGHESPKSRAPEVNKAIIEFLE